MVPEPRIVDGIHGRKHEIVCHNRHRIVILTAMHRALRMDRRGCSREVAGFKRGGRECVEHAECWILNVRFLGLLLLLVVVGTEGIRCGIKSAKVIVETLHVDVGPIRLRGNDLNRRTGGNRLYYSGSPLTISGGSSLLAVEVRLRFLLHDLVLRQQIREEARVEHRGVAVVNSDPLRAEGLNETLYQLDDPLALLLVQEWHWVLAEHLDEESGCEGNKDKVAIGSVCKGHQISRMRRGVGGRRTSQVLCLSMYLDNDLNDGGGGIQTLGGD